MARPRKVIDQRQFENLCGLQCTQEEICSVLDVCEETLNSWCKKTYKQGFSEVFRQKRGKGKVSLRRNQWKLSETNATMAIWLGKQYLGQRDQIETKAADPAAFASLVEALRGGNDEAETVNTEAEGNP